MADDIDLPAYFQRIGYDGSGAPTLETLHALTAAHTQAIPFENLDVLAGVPIELDAGALFRKLVVARRGGYCFEQNGLFLLVLAQLGFHVTPLSGRVRLERPRDFTPPRTHLFLRVMLDGEAWLTDVGVGGASLTSAIRLEPDLVQTTPHERRRIVREEGRWFHQVRYGDTWVDVYEFTGEEMPLIDRTVASWYTSTHPASRFRERLMVARALPEGRRIALVNRELTVRERTGVANTEVLGSDAEVYSVLAEHFGIALEATSSLRLPASPCTP